MQAIFDRKPFGYDIENLEEAICASGALLTYVKSTQNVTSHNIYK